MKWFDKQSYQQKLTFTSVLSSLFAIFTVLLIVGVISFTSARSDMVNNLQATASIIGTSAGSAINTNNSKLAQASLQSLSMQPDILEAKIFLPDQAGTFAEFMRGNSSDSPVRSEMKFVRASQKPVLSNNEILVTEPILDGNQIIGSISLRATLQPLLDKAQLIILLSLAGLGFAILVSNLIWRLTRNIWADPLLRFSKSIRSVTQERDFSKRLEVSSSDELGELTTDFNSMLEQIEKQQKQLLKQHANLEREVEARTHEISKANRNLINEVAERSKTEVNLLKLSSAVTQAEECVIITDNEGYIEYVNPSFEQITGYNARIALGKKPSLLKSDMHEEEFFANLWKTITDGETFKDVFINTRPNGDIYYLEQSITAVRNDLGNITNFVATGRDITERIEQQKTLHHMAHHDGLTGLPNRILLADRIDHAIERAIRENSEIAVMFIDLDGFKMANDVYGHEAGDIVLKNVASRLSATVRSQDTVARISGDEFAVVLEDMHEVSDAGLVARKLMESLCEAYLVGDDEVFVTASIGIAVYPVDGLETRNLLKHADQAMYTAKKKGKARYCFYKESDNDFDTQRLQREQQLIRAVKEKQFVLHYQPLMHTNEKGVHGVEALIRWEHPEHGIIMPDKFIPSLEDSGMINEVGAWVMEEACMQLALWHQQGQTNLIMSINVSPRQLNDNQFINYLVNAIQTSGINPNSLEIELTERMFLAFNDFNVRTLNRVAELGVRIAVDDFGMGHSSLSYLSKLKIDTLKIDRSFINELSKNDGDEKIVSALIGLAERLNISVTAEGVETREQLQVLDKLNCKYAQGWLWSKALPPEEFASWNINETKKLRVIQLKSTS